MSREDDIIEEMVIDPTSHPELRRDPDIDRQVREARSRLGLDDEDDEDYEDDFDDEDFDDEDE